MTLALDLESASFMRDPYPVYERLRAEHPVAHMRLRGLTAGTSHAYFVSRYADVSALLSDPRFAKDPHNAGAREPPMPAFMRPLTRNMLGRDDPDHMRLKRLVQVAFTPRRVELLAANVAAVSEALIDKLRGKPSFDLMADYAFPLPVQVISELLGVPEADRMRFARWSNALIVAGASIPRALLSLPAIISFLRYLKRLIAAKRAAPANDLVSALVAAESDGDKLDADELMAMIAILLSAGHETTTNLIGNGMLALLDDPDAAEALRRDETLGSSAVEELLRFSSPVATSTQRYAREEVNLHGTTIPRGALVFGIIASANRDGSHFVDPDTLHLSRRPNRHLTFGSGGHYCVGAALARLEGAIAFRDLLTRLPPMRLAVDRDRLMWRRGLVLRGLQQMPIALR